MFQLSLFDWVEENTPQDVKDRKKVEDFEYKIQHKKIYNAFLHQLNDRDIPVDKLRLRQGTQPVPEILKPGMKVFTSYGRETIYTVHSIAKHTQNRDFVYPAHYTITCRHKNSKPQYFLNEIVAVNGRLLKLFADADDEIFIVKD
jgi:hypothetical protein